jgi:SAM-dependent methyltransferase
MPDYVSFDRAAPTYEATRGFPSGVADQVADAAAALVGGAGARVLEIGIGTGRIGRPLAARGLRVFGLDLSRAMMAQLLHLTPAGAPRPRLVQAEAARVPLRSGCLDAALAVHVFHLIPDWQGALAEVRRILRPGGPLLAGYDWRPPESPSGRLFDHWRALLRARGCDPHGPGARDFDDVKAYLLGAGARMEEYRVGAWSVTRTVAHALETIEHRTWSSTWTVPEDFFPACLADLRAWAQAEFGSLDQSYTVQHHFVWQAFRWSID